METDEGLYHATPQTRGKIAHETIDSKKASNRANDLQALPVISEKYGLIGKIDLYKGREHKLIECKYQLRNIYQGQFSVYEVNNTQRIIDNIRSKIETKYSKLFGGADSVIIFGASNGNVQKYGNAIHRDVDIVYL